LAEYHAMSHAMLHFFARIIATSACILSTFLLFPFRMVI
jgi:hypothetical protein